MKTVIVLAMHGMPPKDFPSNETGELFSLHARLEHASEAERNALRQRYEMLNARICTWPRTFENDPYHASSLELAGQLSRATGNMVIPGFNEFCAPSLDEALDQAAKCKDVETVIVVTPMMTTGGEHSEVDIPEAIERAHQRHPDIKVTYAWPFDPAQVAEFLTAQITRFVGVNTETG